MSEEFKIDKGIPISRNLKYPFDQMDVGDSFLALGKSIRTYARIWGVRHGKKFCSRKVEGGIRIWRVE